MSKVITVRIIRQNGQEWANLGSGNLALAVALGLQGSFGGTRTQDGAEHLYYNGGCTGAHAAELYQDLVDRTVHAAR